MPLNITILAASIVIAIALVLLLMLHTSLVEVAGGKALAFLGFFILPVLVLAGGTASHLEQSKSTTFCISCHVMEPYWKSLHIDQSRYIPAVHFQNKLIPREQACYTCHRQYAMFGDLKAKMAGVNHMWVYYFGTMPDRIQLYEPYQNRECLHCHAGARSFERPNWHSAFRTELASGKRSCLTCHDSNHGIDQLKNLKFWKEAK